MNAAPSAPLGLAAALTAFVALLSLAERGDAAAFDVDTTVDATDLVPGDGACDDGSGACSLRAAIQESNALTGIDAVNVPAGVYRLTLHGEGGGHLSVTDEVHIVGADRDGTIIDGDASDGVLDMYGSVENLTIRNGTTGITGNGGVELRNVLVTENDGGGVFGCFVVIDSVVSNNKGLGVTSGDCGNDLEVLNSRVVYNDGNGIVCGDHARCKVEHSYIGENAGVGIGSDGENNVIDIENTTVEANAEGVVVPIDSGVTIRDSDIVNNFGDGIVGNLGSTADVLNSTVSGNGGTGIVAFEDCEQEFITVGIGGSTITGNGQTGIHIRPSDVGGPPCGYPTLGASVLAGNGHGIASVDCTGGGHLVSGGSNVIEDSGTCIVLGDRIGDVCGIPPSSCPVTPSTTTTSTTLPTTTLGTTTTSTISSPTTTSIVPTTTSETASTTSLPSEKCGDVDNDGRLSAVDALFVLRASVESSNCLPAVCDATGDGSVTASDALRVLQAAVGLAVALQCA